MSIPDEKEFFSWQLSEDTATLTIELNSEKQQYTSEEVSKLALFFANMPSQMIPKVPEQSHLDEVPAVQCKRYEIYQDPTSGEAEIYLQIPGLFWSYVHLNKENISRAIETLYPKNIKNVGGTSH